MISKFCGTIAVESFGKDETAIIDNIRELDKRFIFFILQYHSC